MWAGAGRFVILSLSKTCGLSAKVFYFRFVRVCNTSGLRRHLLAHLATKLKPYLPGLLAALLFQYNERIVEVIEYFYDIRSYATFGNAK